MDTHSGMIVAMTDEPKADRHTTDRHPVSVPGRDWKKFGLVVGGLNRSKAIRELIRRYLAQEPMPPLGPPSEWDKLP